MICENPCECKDPTASPKCQCRPGYEDYDGYCYPGIFIDMYMMSLPKHLFKLSLASIFKADIFGGIDCI